MIFIEWISDWAQAIIVAVIIGTVIEMILPEGNSKKYIKVVIGVYVLFTIISPIITKFTGKNIEVSDVLELDQYIEEAKKSANVQNSLQNENQNNIMSIYSSGIRDDIKAKVEAKGYEVYLVDIGVADNEEYTIESITISVAQKEEKDNEEETTNQNTTHNLIDKVEEVNKVEISIGENNNSVEDNEADAEDGKELTSSQRAELKEYLSGVYEVNENSITIN